MRILVMDDYRSHGESLAEFLAAKGHEALYAETYAEAQWLVDLMRFDFALLDFDMPGMSGPRVAQGLAKRLPKIQSVIMSAKTPSGVRLAELGGLRFLQKPVYTSALLEILGQLERDMAGLALVQRSSFSLVKYVK